MPSRQEITRAFESSTMLAGGESAVETFNIQADYQSADALESAGKKKKGRLGRLTWTFKTADRLNNNRRIYPSSAFKVALEDLQTRVATNTVYGRLDHPEMYRDSDYLVTINDAAVKIHEVTMANETDVTVVADIMDNEYGRQLVSVLEVGGNPGVSQRALARWREATPEERTAYQIPEDVFVSVAESMRLITYDVVGQPGFSDATGAKATEANHTQGAEKMTLEEFKAKHPDLYASITNEAKAEGKREAEKNANEASQTAVAEKDAEIKALTEAANEAKENAKAAIDALAAVKPAMESLGIVNEKITDAEAAAQIATSKAALEAANQQLEATKAELKKANEQVESANRSRKIRTALEAVASQYDKSPARDAILKLVAKGNHEDQAKALEAAAEIAETLGDLTVPKAQPASEGVSGSDILKDLLRSNPQNPEGKESGGGTPGNESLTRGIFEDGAFV